MNRAGRTGKERAGLEAAARVRSGMVVGLGTGSTAAFFVRELGRRVREEKLQVVGVPTSFSSARLAREVGVPVRALADVERIDLAVDGADEVDEQRNCIKGGGAAHTQEKVVDTFAERFLVVADDSKLVKILGERCPVPLEVLPFALEVVTRRVEALGARVAVRTGSGKDGPVVSDQGNPVLDAHFGPIADPAGLASRLDAIPGLVEHGLFVGVVHEVVVGMEDGTLRSF